MSAPSSRAVATGSETLAVLLERLNEGSALGDGRAFVDGRRAAATDGAAELARGSVVEVYTARAMAGALAILRVDGGLAFVNKPPGIATEPEKRGSGSCVVYRAAAALGVAAGKVHALSRLDVGVSGVVMLGLEPAAQRRVQAWREKGLVRRRYVAVAAGVPEPEGGEWNDSIGKGGRGALRAVRADGEPAHTRYTVCSTATRGAIRACVLALSPSTGRTHQLRVHAAFHGAPLFGDKSYGGPGRAVAESGAVLALDRIFLHAAWIALPNFGTVEAPLPNEFEALWSSLGGELGALGAARAPDVAERHAAR